MPNPEKTVLITGGCGYLGSQLICDLAHHPAFREWDIRVLDNLGHGNLSALMNLPSDHAITFVEGDVLDLVTLRRALQGVSTVIHLAAIVRTPMSFDHPIWMAQVNHWGTAHLVEACLELHVSRFFYAGSTVVYGPGGPYSASSPCQPLGPYAQSKHEAEQHVLACGQRGLEPTILRFGMLFGHAPVIRFDNVVNRFAYLSGTGRQLPVHGTGQQQRPVLHVKDASHALIKCLREDAPTVANVVGDNPSINDIAKHLVEFAPKTTIRYTEQDVLTHLSFVVQNSDDVYVPRYGLDEGLRDLAARFGGLRAPPSPAEDVI
jgi:UDP-glucose 4-epimerase